jgi:predicted nucleotidyltransferase
MGSEAYSINSPDISDKDFYGFCIPPVSYVFPHTSGYIHGFDEIPNFLSWQQHHVQDPSQPLVYDFQIFNIVHYFRLLADGNPNMIDSIFTPDECVVRTSQIANLVRLNRKLFLTKKLYHKFKGYSYSQMKKLKERAPHGKRVDLVEKFSFDTKYASHGLRLILQIEQILEEGELDIRKNKELLKSVRRGEWTLDQITDFLNEKDKHIDRLYETSSLPHSPDYTKIKQLLIDCLEQHYGSLSNLINRSDSEYAEIVDKIRRIVN